MEQDQKLVELSKMLDETSNNLDSLIKDAEELDFRIDDSNYSCIEIFAILTPAIVLVASLALF